MHPVLAFLLTVCSPAFRKAKKAEKEAAAKKIVDDQAAVAKKIVDDQAAAAKKIADENLRKETDFSANPEAYIEKYFPNIYTLISGEVLDIKTQYSWDESEDRHLYVYVNESSRLCYDFNGDCYNKYGTCLLNMHSYKAGVLKFKENVVKSLAICVKINAEINSKKW